MFVKKTTVPPISREIQELAWWLALLLSCLLFYGMAYSWLGWVAPGDRSLLESWRTWVEPWF